MLIFHNKCQGDNFNTDPLELNIMHPRYFDAHLRHIPVDFLHIFTKISMLSDDPMYEGISID